MRGNSVVDDFLSIIVFNCMGFCVWFLFCYSVLILSSFAIILMRKSCFTLMWLFFTLSWVGLQCVIVVFPGVILTFLVIFLIDQGKTAF